MANRIPLDKLAEQELVRRWRSGDARARNRLMTECRPLVVGIAHEYRRWGVAVEDIVQQGSVGLLRAIEKFDPQRDCRLATYAAYWIRAEIRDYVMRGYRVVRLGTTKAEKRAVRAYRRSRATDPTTLAAVSGLPRERVEWLLPLLAGREASIDAQHEGHGAIVDRLAGSGPDPEEVATTHETRGRAREAIHRAMDDLTARERMIVRERLMSDEPRTLRELGLRLGVSKERVRQIEERAATKLRAKLEELRGEAA